MTAAETQVLVSDVCDTLYRSNTTVDFVRFVLSRSGRRGRELVFRATTTPPSPLWVAAAVSFKLAHVDLGRYLLVGLLRGYTRAQLRELGEDFVGSYLRPRGIPEPLARVREAVSRGERVVLASASIDPVVAAVAAHLGVEHVSSTLAFASDGRCEGFLARDLTGVKLPEVERHVPQGARVTVMSDNLSDRGLLSWAERRVVVLRRPRDRALWGDFEAEYLSGWP